MSEESSAELRHAPKAHLLTTQKMICSRLGGKHSAFQFFSSVLISTSTTPRCWRSVVCKEHVYERLRCEHCPLTSREPRMQARGPLDRMASTRFGERAFTTTTTNPSEWPSSFQYCRYVRATCALRRVAESMRTPKGFLPGQKGGSTPH